LRVYASETGTYIDGTPDAIFITYSKSALGGSAMNRLILTIAIILCATSVSAGDHRENNNGHHYGQSRNHNSDRNHECRYERDWRYRTVVYRPEYRGWRELPTRHVVYRPEYRKAEPQVSISVQTPGLILSFLTGR